MVGSSQLYRLLALVALIAGLALGGAFFTTPSTAASAGTAQVRLVHASPDAPAIDVTVDGQRIITAMSFADATPYVSLPAGSHAVQVFSSAAGQASTALLSTTVDFQDGVAYTIVAADRLAQMGAVVLTDSLATSAGAQAYVRLVHASPDAPSVADVAVVGGPVAYRNLPFKAASPYLPIAAGTYSFEIRPAGTTQALATTSPLTLETGRLYSAFVVGQLRDNTLRALLIPDNAGTGGVAVVPRTGGGATATPRGEGLPLLLTGALLLGSLAFVRTLRPHGTRRG